MNGTLIGLVWSPEQAAMPAVAAAALRRAACARGTTLALETHSALGVRDPLSAEQISAANAIVIASDGAHDDTRFAGKTLHRVRLDDAMRDADGIIARAMEAASRNGPSEASQDASSANRKQTAIVAITSCPTGIAHTFMAAEGLMQGARTIGATIHVETQGSVGAQNTLTDDQIADADLVVIAADTQVDKRRFAGKRLYETGTKGAIGNGAALLRDALEHARVEGARPARDRGNDTGNNGRATAGTNAGETGLIDRVAAAKRARAARSSGPYRHLMTGVSFMLPFVVAGGLLIAISFALGGIYAFDDAHKGTLAWSLFQIGAKAAFALIVPVLSGYIAYSIADRPGIAPGMVGGMLAASLGAGFLGGIIAGFLAGYVALGISRHLKLHRNLEGLKPVLIIPLLSTLVVGLLMIYVVGTPVAGALKALETWLRSMQTSSALVLGALLGAMMAFDMGGPVNKAAYAFSTGLIASQVYTPMAAVMAAGMTPPLGIAMATWLFRNRFMADEREAGNAAAVLGIAFITEGTIPFAARDPVRVIPACMIGSAIAGAISMSAGAELKVPHGGIFVLPIPNAVTHLGIYVAAIVAGAMVTALAVGVLKRPAMATEAA